MLACGRGEAFQELFEGNKAMQVGLAEPGSRYLCYGNFVFRIRVMIMRKADDLRIPHRMTTVFMKHLHSFSHLTVGALSQKMITSKR